ncbi:MAG: hypothetical protein ABI847_08220 [Anaerolineales bacterium]
MEGTASGLESRPAKTAATGEGQQQHGRRGLGGKDQAGQPGRAGGGRRGRGCRLANGGDHVGGQIALKGRIRQRLELGEERAQRLGAGGAVVAGGQVRFGRGARGRLQDLVEKFVQCFVG